jgi:hypothetical protein
MRDPAAKSVDGEFFAFPPVVVRVTQYLCRNFPWPCFLEQNFECIKAAVMWDPRFNTDRLVTLVAAIMWDPRFNSKMLNALKAASVLILFITCTHPGIAAHSIFSLQRSFYLFILLSLFPY